MKYWRNFSHLVPHKADECNCNDWTHEEYSCHEAPAICICSESGLWCCGRFCFVLLMLANVIDLIWKLDNVISLSLMLFIVLECYISIGVQLWVATTGLLSLADEEEASEKKYDSHCSERGLKGSFLYHLHRGDMGQNTGFCEGLLEIRW